MVSCQALLARRGERHSIVVPRREGANDTARHAHRCCKAYAHISVLAGPPTRGVLSYSAGRQVLQVERRRGVVAAAGATAVAAAAAEAAGLVALSFTPVHALLGGLVLGLATASKLLTTGRILGISGAARGLINMDFAPWRLCFLGGMAAGSLAITQLLPGAVEMVRPSCPMWRTALSGLLVGLGTSLGNGCTSGHGIAGSARLSPRSFAYTATFMAAGMAAATASRSAACAGVAPAAPPLQLPSPAEWRLAAGVLGGTAVAFLALAALGRVVGGKVSPPPAAAAAVVSTAAAGPAPAAAGDGGAVAPPPPSAAAALPAWLDLTAEFIAGAAFALGLGLSGMAHPTKVVAFLSPLYPAWDLSLPFVMAGAIAVAIVAFQGVIRFKMLPKPLFQPRFQLPASNAIDARLLTGGLLFGAGWGLSGLCPGPALVNAFAHMDPHVYVYLTTLLLGMAAESRLLSGWLAPPPPPNKR